MTVMHMQADSPDTVTFAKALADETRQRIMAFCCCHARSVGEIVEALEVTQPTVSHHLGILRNANLVIVRRKGKQVFYELNQERLADACCSVANTFAPECPMEVKG